MWNNNIEKLTQNQDNLNQKEVNSHLEKLKKSKEKWFFDKAWDKISEYYTDIEKSVKKDIKEKNWWSLLMKWWLALWWLFLAKKATELVASTTKSIFSIFGFGKDALWKSAEKTKSSFLITILKWAWFWSAAALVYEAFNSDVSITEWMWAWQKWWIIWVWTKLIEKIKDWTLKFSDDTLKQLYKIPTIWPMLKLFIETSWNEQKNIDLSKLKPKTEWEPNWWWRTDRHNNPTAMIYEWFKKRIESLNKYREWIDFSKWDSFVSKEDWKTYHTMRFKNPEIWINATIDLIDKFWFYTDSWETNQRWNYIWIKKTEWNKKTRTEKLKIIRWMYYHEAGNWSLFDGIDFWSEENEEIDKNIYEKALSFWWQALLFFQNTNRHLIDDIANNSYLYKEYWPKDWFLKISELTWWNNWIEWIVNDFANWLIKFYNWNIDNIKEIWQDVFIAYLWYKFSNHKTIIAAYVLYWLSVKHNVIKETFEHFLDPIQLFDKVASWNAFVETSWTLWLSISTILYWNPVHHTIQITKWFMDTFLSEFEKNDSDWLILVWAWTWLLAFWKMWYWWIQAQYEIITWKEFSLHPNFSLDKNKWIKIDKTLWFNDTLRYDNKYIIRTLKSMSFPIPTREVRYLINSMLETIPWIKTIKTLNLKRKMAKVEMYIQEINEIKSNLKNWKITETDAKSKLTRYAEKIKWIVVNKRMLEKFPTSKMNYKFYQSLEKTWFEIENLTRTARWDKWTTKGFFDQFEIFNKSFQKNKWAITNILARYEIFKSWRYFKSLWIDKLINYWKEKIISWKEKIIKITKDWLNKIQSKIKPEIPKSKIGKFKPKLKLKWKALLFALLWGVTVLAANEITWNDDEDLEWKTKEKKYNDENFKKNPIAKNLDQSKTNISNLIPKLDISEKEKNIVAKSESFLKKVKWKEQDEINEIYYEELKKKYPKKFEKLKNEKINFLENSENRKILKSKLEDFWTKYDKYLIEIKNKISSNKKEFKDQLWDNDKLQISETIYLIKNKNWELELKYISKVKYSEWIHSQFIPEPSWNKTFWIANETLVEWWTWMIPFYWSWRDLKRSVEKFQSWNYNEAWSDLKWWVVWMTFDVVSVAAAFLTAPLLWAWWAWVQAWKVAILWSLKWIKSAKTLSRLTKTAKITWWWMLWMTAYDFWKNPENFDKSEIIN